MSTDGGFAGSFAQKQFYFSPLCATEHTHTNYACVCECRGYGRMYGYVCSCLHVHVTSVSAAYISLDTELSYTHWGGTVSFWAALEVLQLIL